jgi:hypothetical protein
MGKTFPSHCGSFHEQFLSWKEQHWGSGSRKKRYDYWTKSATCILGSISPEWTFARAWEQLWRSQRRGHFCCWDLLDDLGEWHRLSQSEARRAEGTGKELAHQRTAAGPRLAKILRQCDWLFLTCKKVWGHNDGMATPDDAGWKRARGDREVSSRPSPGRALVVACLILQQWD